MTSVEDVFPLADYICYPDQKYSICHPCVPRGFERIQLKPGWLSKDNTKWETIVNGMDSLTPNDNLSDQEIVQSVYYHLVWLEDMLAIYDDRRSTIAESTIAMTWNETNNEKWRTLMAQACQTNTFSIPDYYRRSLCLITPEWMNTTEYKSLLATPCNSMTFTPVESIPLTFNSDEDYWKVNYID